MKVAGMRSSSSSEETAERQVLRSAGNVTRNREPVDCEPTEVIAGDCRETINNRHHGGEREESLRKE